MWFNPRNSCKLDAVATYEKAKRTNLGSPVREQKAKSEKVQGPGDRRESIFRKRDIFKRKADIGAKILR